ncbi:Tc5 transposase DNA-binding domain [Popillia japonica]|uniref:Tc5 transposase DNA-binding domain n=1 Tax=Popillia japonica TaxID=7064 RepID=A0AAW1LDZ4_POPJA
MEIEFAIIKRAEKGQRPSFIGKALELSRSTVGTIMKDKIRIMEHGKGMEKLLVIWLEDQNRQNSIRISLALVQEKARSIFLHYAARIESEGSCDEEFKASKGWYEEFKASKVSPPRLIKTLSPTTSSVRYIARCLFLDFSLRTPTTAATTRAARNHHNDNLPSREISQKKTDHGRRSERHLFSATGITFALNVDDDDDRHPPPLPRAAAMGETEIEKRKKGGKERRDERSLLGKRTAGRRDRENSRGCKRRREKDRSVILKQFRASRHE